MSDALEALTAADRTWAARRRVPAARPEYLVHLAAALAPAHGADVREVRKELTEARTQVRSLVEATTGRWTGLRGVKRQVAEALRELDLVRAYLESLEQEPEPQARAG